MFVLSAMGCVMLCWCTLQVSKSRQYGGGVVKKLVYPNRYVVWSSVATTCKLERLIFVSHRKLRGIPPGACSGTLLENLFQKAKSRTLYGV